MFAVPNTTCVRDCNSRESKKVLSSTCAQSGQIRSSLRHLITAQNNLRIVDPARSHIPPVFLRRPGCSGQTKRTCLPLRTASDAFAVQSFESANSDKGRSDKGSGGGRCCFGGPGNNRPVKCQRCGSGRVHLFATTLSSANSWPGLLHHHPSSRGTSSRRNNKHPGWAAAQHHFNRAPPAGGGGRGGSSRRSSGSIGRRSLAPIDNSHNHMSTKKGGALPPQMVSITPDHTKLTGWSSNVQSPPLPTTTATAATGATAFFPGEGARGSSTSRIGLYGEKKAVRLPEVRALQVGRKASVRPPLGR